MGKNLHICKWGSSLAVRIPKTIAEQWGVSEGSAIEMDSRDDLVVLRKKSYDLADLLSQITVDNLHQEQEIGESKGSEKW